MECIFQLFRTESVQMDLRDVNDAVKRLW